MPSSVFAAVRARQPLIHAITNPVTMNDVVNMILASGALAICADNPEETREITLLSDGLLLNTGMPCDEKLRAMIRAGRAANENGIPVVLDPVGAGASQYRKRFLKELLRQVRVDCVRANRSETAALCGVSFEARGVESADVSADTDSIRRLSEKLDAVIAVTGERNGTEKPHRLRDAEEDHWRGMHAGRPDRGGACGKPDEPFFERGAACRRRGCTGRARSAAGVWRSGGNCTGAHAVGSKGRDGIV